MSLARALAAFSGMTMLSRIAGLAREILIAAYLGAGGPADAFYAAFRLPNLFRRIFAEGAFSTAFTPMFARKLELEGHEAARSFGAQAQALLGAALLAFTLVALVAMPLLVYVIAAGFGEDPAKRDLTILLARIMFPYLALVSLTALYGATLNSFGYFAEAAAAPIVLNILMIFAMLGADALGWPMPETIAASVTIAGLGQLLIVLRAAKRLNIGLPLVRPRLTDDMRKMLRFAAPAALSGGAMQINILIGSTIASFFAGAVSWLAYADRLYQLPLGVVGVAIGVTLLPELSRKAAAKDAAGARGSLNRAMEFGLIATLPAAVALIAMPQTLMSVLFERGAFTAEDSAAAAKALAIYAAGLPAFVLLKAVAPAYYAEEDSKTPLRYAAWGMALNTALALGGAFFWGWLAIPAATTIAGWLNLVWLWRGPKPAEARQIDERLKRRAPRILLASLIMGAVVWGAAALLQGPLSAPVTRIFALAGVVAGSMAVYFGALMALGAGSPSELKAALRRRR